MHILLLVTVCLLGSSTTSSQKGKRHHNFLVDWVSQKAIFLYIHIHIYIYIYIHKNSCLFIYWWGCSYDYLREPFIPTPILRNSKGEFVWVQYWILRSKNQRWPGIHHLTLEETYKVGRLVGFFKQWWPIHYMGSDSPYPCLLSFGKNQYSHRDELKNLHQRTA